MHIIEIVSFLRSSTWYSARERPLCLRARWVSCICVSSFVPSHCSCCQNISPAAYISVHSKLILLTELFFLLSILMRISSRRTISANLLWKLSSPGAKGQPDEQIMQKPVNSLFDLLEFLSFIFQEIHAGFPSQTLHNQINGPIQEWGCLFRSHR